MRPVRRLLLSVVLAMLDQTRPLSAVAQSCPPGSEYAYTEDRGDERVVHCAKPRTGPDAALRALRKSELGRRISEFLDANKVPIRVDGARLWAPGSGAAFDRGFRAILLPPEAVNRDAVSLAVSIAHEGYHAIQSIELGMVPCIEAEQDAAFVQFVVYFEMVKRGAVRLRDVDPLAEDLGLFAGAVKTGRLGPFDRAVRRAYAGRRESVLRLGGFLPPLGRVLVGSALRLCDLVWNLTEDFETLDQQTMHAAYLWDKRPVKRTRAAHQEEEAWKNKWIRDHRHEFSQYF